MRIAHELRTPLEGRLRDPYRVSTTSRSPSGGLPLARSRFSIGIDLGTTNCALAFVALDGEAESEVLRIPQWDSLAVMAEAPMLPSFLYLPEEAVAAHLRKKAADGRWVVGRFARTRAIE